MGDTSTRRCIFRGWNARLLVEKIPLPDLLSAWRLYVPLAAQAEWAQALGLDSKPKKDMLGHLSLAERAQRIQMSNPRLHVPSALPAGLEDQDENLYEEDGDGMVV